MIKNTLKEFIDKGFKKLHLGCGTDYKNGYINIDFPPDNIQIRTKQPDILCDFTKLDFPQNFFQEILLKHVFEHFQRHIAISLLCKWYYMLENNKLLIIAVPDFEQGVFEYINGNNKRKKEMIRHLYGSHHADWAVHCEGWDKNNLKEILECCGFKTKSIIQSKGQWPELLISSEKIKENPNINKIKEYILPMSYNNTKLLNLWIETIQKEIK